jgi:hypothetical protein
MVRSHLALEAQVKPEGATTLDRPDDGIELASKEVRGTSSTAVSPPNLLVRPETWNTGGIARWIPLWFLTTAASIFFGEGTEQA